MRPTPLRLKLEKNLPKKYSNKKLENSPFVYWNAVPRYGHLVFAGVRAEIIVGAVRFRPADRTGCLL